ncbi:CatA-like O-acetyltransferase [Enterococcus caccae]|uniref:CatA-like O-acetyltransferase n=1 Tax=Enterococcus caccae TaxID=317735 RepID=UPI001FDFDF56|nr:CatA-like O-acetyltransferase [Enterococcus caccae]
MDQTNWDRKAHFDFFTRDDSSPLYGITIQIDIIHFYQYMKENQLSHYYVLIHATTKIMNLIENFRYKIRGKDVLLVERLIPSFTDLNVDMVFM